MTAFRQSLIDIFTFPSLSSRSISIWQRNFLYFRYTLWISILWVFIEPLLFLVAIGYGLGSMVEEVQGRTYLQFFYPALAMASGMMVAFFEASYTSYSKLTRQRTFQTMLLAPLRASDIVVGEVTWAASKGWLSSSAVLLISLSIGLIEPRAMFLLMVFAAVNALVFSAFGFLMTSFVKNYDGFTYAQAGFIMPMYLFSGTFFPLEKIPESLVWITEIFPLTHSVRIARSIAYAQVHSGVWLSLAILFVFIFVFLNWASSRLQRQLTH